MYTYEGLDPSIDYITVPGNASTSSFIAGTWQTGQNEPDRTKADLCSHLAPGYTCCFGTKFTAAACHSMQSDLNYIPATTYGNATLVVDTFELNVSVAQKEMQIFFGHTIPKMSVFGVDVTCDKIHYYN